MSMRMMYKLSYSKCSFFLSETSGVIFNSRSKRLCWSLVQVHCVMLSVTHFILTSLFSLSIVDFIVYPGEFNPGGNPVMVDPTSHSGGWVEEREGGGGGQ